MTGNPETLRSIFRVAFPATSCEPSEEALEGIDDLLTDVVKGLLAGLSRDKLYEICVASQQPPGPCSLKHETHVANMQRHASAVLDVAEEVTA
jgi:hypothetical protein